MTYAEISQIAEILASIGVMLTVLFVGLELRRANVETNLQNTREQLTMLSEFKSRTNDPAMADLVERGRKSYKKLAPSEKIAFGLYLEQGIHAAMAVHYHSGQDIAEKEASLQSSKRHLLAILDHPGTREWWQEVRKTTPLIDYARRRIDSELGFSD